MDSKNKNIFQRLYNSIYITDSINRKKNTVHNFILHLHPAIVPEKTLKLTHTWGLGGMAAFLIVLLGVSGLLLRFFYKPFPAYSYESILTIQNSIIFGAFIRNIHHWSGTFLLIISVLHLLRVFLTRAFLPPRQFNWVIGLCLLFFIMLSNYTGYLLPWDQLSYWAITVSTNMLHYVPLIGDILLRMVRGGEEVGAATLIIYYNLHTGVLPILILTTMGYHFWRIRKAGGVVIPGGNEMQEKIKMVQTVPDLIVREFVVALVLLSFIFTLSLFINAPLLEKANPALSPDPVKAPWYFIGIQELLMHFHPFFAIDIIPGIVIISLFLIPYFNYDSKRTGIWFISPTGRKTAVISVVSAFILTIAAVVLSEYWLNFADWFPGLPLIISNGVFPFLIVSLTIIVFYFLLKRKYPGEDDEIIQSLFIFTLTVLIVLTITGLWFRGKGMILMWPF